MGSKYDLRQMKKVVYWLSTYNLSVVKMGSKHDSPQMKKVVHWRSAYSLSVSNMGAIHDSFPNEEIRLLAFDLQPIHIENGF
jgi:hypothetical protein